MNTWRADWLLRVLLTWTSLTFLIAWLPFVRSAFDGDSYTWGFGWWGFAAGGTGLSAPGRVGRNPAVVWQPRRADAVSLVAARVAHGTLHKLQLPVMGKPR